MWSLGEVVGGVAMAVEWLFCVHTSGRAVWAQGESDSDDDVVESGVSGHCWSAHSLATVVSGVRSVCACSCHN